VSPAPILARGLLRPDGSLVIDSAHHDEGQIWAQALPIVDREEVQAATRRGFRIVSVSIQIS